MLYFFTQVANNGPLGPAYAFMLASMILVIIWCMVLPLSLLIRSKIAYSNDQAFESTFGVLLWSIAISWYVVHQIDIKTTWLHAAYAPGLALLSMVFASIALPILWARWFYPCITRDATP